MITKFSQVFFSSFDMLKLEGVSNSDSRALRSNDDL